MIRQLRGSWLLNEFSIRLNGIVSELDDDRYDRLLQLVKLFLWDMFQATVERKGAALGTRDA